jgi:hypothetical protein
MNIPDPWMGASGPGAAGQTVDLTEEVIGKRRLALDAAKNFLKNKARQAQQSTAGQKVAQVAGATAQNIKQNPMFQQPMGAVQNIGQNPMFQQAMRAVQNLPGGPLPYAMGATALGTVGYALGRQQGYQNSTAPGILPTAAATSLGGPLAGIGYATGRYRGRKNAQRDEAAAVNPAAQMPLY